jgi:NADPH:quinone reductase-like Zn-dependent oxidoreductase/SAM-dependent methyltransferase/NAD(P)-dependent dehydrogenase (short-subunit alcohol dehydrogenase family)
LFIDQNFLRQVKDNYVFPGAGYLVMAIEAALQVADNTSNVIGLHLKDVNFHSMLIVPDTIEGVEINLTLSPMRDSYAATSSAWKSFEISSYSENSNTWTTHCTGFITLDCEKSLDPIDGGREAQADCQRWDNLLQGRAAEYQLSVNTSQFYTELARRQVKLGAAFQGLTKLSISGRQLGGMMGTATVPDIKSRMPKGHLHPHLIHPTTLDNALQATIVATYDQNYQAIPRRGLVPIGIKSFWISTACPAETGSSFRLTSTVSSREYDAYKCDLNAWTGADGSHRAMSFDGVHLSPIQSTSSIESGRDSQRYYTMEWQPDIYLLTNQSLDKLIKPASGRISTYEAECHWFSQLQLAATLLVTDALTEIQGLDISGLEAQYHRFHDLLRNVAAEVVTGAIPYVSLEAWYNLSRNPSLKHQLYQEVEAADTNGAVLMRMGSNIAAFFRKDVDPLYKMFGQDNLLMRYYDEDMKMGSIPALLAEYLKVLRWSRCGLRILEIGAGTGGFTECVLRHLAPAGVGTTIEEYLFTDLSPSFFAHAKERLGTWQDILRYKKLDIGVDPAIQDFERGTVDLVVASNVLHATPRIQETLRRVHYLLKPGGQLLFLEGVRQETLWSNVSFSALPGWWLGQEPIRRWCPYVPVAEWRKFLHNSGFSGVDLEFPSSLYPEFNKVSVMISTAAAANDTDKPPDVVILCHEEDTTKHIPQTLLSRFHSLGLNVALLPPAQHWSCDLSHTICLSILELWHPFLSNVEKNTFQDVWGVLDRCEQLLWVTGDPTTEPKYDLVVGLLRTLRWEREQDQLNLTTLAVEDPDANSEVIVDAIIRVFQKQFVQAVIPDQRNAEYRLRDTVIHTNRIQENSIATSAIASHLMEPEPCMEAWDKLNRPVKLSITRPGSLDAFCWVTDTDLAEVPLGEHEVEVEVRAVGLNFRDLLAATGVVHQVTLGGEAAGIVVEVGTSVTSVKAGDRVAYLSDPSPSRMGTLRTRGRALDSLVVKIPSSLSFEIAAGLPVIHCTVLYALQHLAHLADGECILIHAAAGDVGQAATQFAQSVGAEVFATVSTVAEKELLISEFGIAEDHIFSSNDLNFFNGIRRMAPRGMNVILNSLSGEALQRSWACLAPLGRFIELGKSDLLDGTRLDMTPFLRNVTMASVDLLVVSQLRPATVQLLLQEMIRLFSARQLHEARPTRTLGYGQLADGLRLLQKGQNTGKMVLIPNAMQIPVIPPLWEPYSLDPNASYLLAGGLGGIGRSIAARLAMRGARHLIFLSRSGKVTKGVREMIARLEEHGCASHIFQCDVADQSRLNSVVVECQKTLPPIKGCIQCSVSWKDGVFHGMSHDSWQTTIAPKVHGTWNLHQLFADVDLFIILSSVAGIIGNRSQASYNAGNTFEDALAHYRVSQGLRAVSLDLGVMLSVGYMAENPELVTHSMTVAHQHTEAEMLVILDYLLDGCYHAIGSLPTAQLICGLYTKLSYRQRDAEPPKHLEYPMFAKLQTSSVASNLALASGNAKPKLSIQDRLGNVGSRAEAVDVVSNGIQWKLANLLNVPDDQMDSTKDIRSNGVDSLMEMEFRGWLLKDLGASIPIRELTTGSVRDLSARVVAVSTLACLRSLA